MSLPPTGSSRRGGRTCDASLFFADFGIDLPATEAGRLPPWRLFFPLDFFRETGIG